MSSLLAAHREAAGSPVLSLRLLAECRQGWECSGPFPPPQAFVQPGPQHLLLRLISPPVTSVSLWDGVTTWLGPLNISQLLQGPHSSEPPLLAARHGQGGENFLLEAGKLPCSCCASQTAHPTWRHWATSGRPNRLPSKAAPERK